MSWVFGEVCGLFSFMDYDINHIQETSVSVLLKDEYVLGDDLLVCLGVFFVQQITTLVTVCLCCN